MDSQPASNYSWFVNIIFFSRWIVERMYRLKIIHFFRIARAQRWNNDLTPSGWMTVDSYVLLQVTLSVCLWPTRPSFCSSLRRVSGPSHNISTLLSTHSVSLLSQPLSLCSMQREGCRQNLTTGVSRITLAMLWRTRQFNLEVKQSYISVTGHEIIYCNVIIAVTKIVVPHSG